MDWPEAGTFVSESSGFDPPSLFAKAMCQTIPIEPHRTRLMDLGCGSGIVGIYGLIERKARCVTFVDVLPEAISATQTNVSKQIKRQIIRASQVDYMTGSFADLSAQVVASHDLIAFNAPQLPTALTDSDYLKEVASSRIMSTFRLGGPDGLRVIRDFLRWYTHLPIPRPIAVVVMSSFLGHRQINDAISQHQLQARIIAETIVPLRGCLTGAAETFLADTDELRNRSLEIHDGKWTKVLLTIQLS